MDIIASAHAKKVATQAINLALKQKVALNIHYEDLISIKTDSRGKVVLMQPNTGEINRLASEATLEVQKFLAKFPMEKVFIPFGQLTGNQMIANLGPQIPIILKPLGVVDTKILDRFEEAGINQIRHKIYMEVSSKVRIVIPLFGSEVSVKTEVPISEAIIMGEVPQVYFHGFSKTEEYVP